VKKKSLKTTGSSMMGGWRPEKKKKKETPPPPEKKSEGAKVQKLKTREVIPIGKRGGQKRGFRRAQTCGLNTCIQSKKKSREHGTEKLLRSKPLTPFHQ